MYPDHTVLSNQDLRIFLFCLQQLYSVPIFSVTMVVDYSKVGR